MLERMRSAVICALTVVLLVAVLAQVMLRYLTDLPVAWTEELSRYAFVWLVMLGAVEGSRRAAHFVIDFLPRRLTGLPARVLRLCLLLGEAFAYFLMCASGIAILPVVHAQASITLGAPLSVAYVAIPVGFGLMALQVLLQGVRQPRPQEVA